jgi:hypothetical protein
MPSKLLKSTQSLLLLLVMSAGFANDCCAVSSQLQSAMIPFDLLPSISSHVDPLRSISSLFDTLRSASKAPNLQPQIQKPKALGPSSLISRTLSSTPTLNHTPLSPEPHPYTTTPKTQNVLTINSLSPKIPEAPASTTKILSLYPWPQQLDRN